MKPAATRRRPPHPVRPDSAPLLAVGAPAFAMAAWCGNHFSRLLLMYRQIDGYIAGQVNLFLAFYILGLIPDRARGAGGAGAPVGVWPVVVVLAAFRVGLRPREL
jgi:hypothetical protein